MTMNVSFLHPHAATPGRNEGDAPGRRRGRRLVVGFLAPLLAVVLVAGCGQTPPAAQEKKAIEVIVTTPVRGEVTDYQDFTGRLEGLKTVEIRARVTGFVMRVPFKEGDLVHEGDLLFE